MQSAKDVYQAELLQLGHGVPLYDPDPAGEYEEVATFDVGYVDARFGRFHRIFNAALPKDHESNRPWGTPRDFEPIQTCWARTYSGNALPAGPMHSSHVRVLGGDIGVSGDSIVAHAKISFSISNHQGAALVIKHNAYREDAYCEMELQKYMLKNYRSWLNFIRDELGRAIELRNIVLVTGRDLTADWATAAFVEKYSECNVEFKAGDPSFGAASGAFWGKWHSTANIPHRCGPGPVRPPDTTSNTAMVNSGATEVANVRYNQCIFLRGYRVSERRLLFPKVMKAAAEPEDLNMDRDEECAPKVLSMDYASDQSTSDDDERLSTHNSKLKTAHNIIMDFVLQKTDADVVIVHDTEVCEIAKMVKGNWDKLSDLTVLGNLKASAIQSLDPNLKVCDLTNSIRLRKFQNVEIMNEDQHKHPDLSGPQSSQKNINTKHSHTSLNDPMDVVSMDRAPRSLAYGLTTTPSAGLPTPKRMSSKPKGSVRAKSGCYTCRIRRKKCDERPDVEGSCQTCVRLRLQCLGFGAKRPDWMHESNSVTELRGKIKGFLAQNGMIKGHSASSESLHPSGSSLSHTPDASNSSDSTSPSSLPPLAGSSAVAVQRVNAPLSATSTLEPHALNEFPPPFASDRLDSASPPSTSLSTPSPPSFGSPGTVSTPHSFRNAVLTPDSYTSYPLAPFKYSPYTTDYHISLSRSSKATSTSRSRSMSSGGLPSTMDTVRIRQRVPSHLWADMMPDLESTSSTDSSPEVFEVDHLLVPTSSRTSEVDKAQIVGTTESKLKSEPFDLGQGPLWPDMCGEIEDGISGYDYPYPDRSL